MAARTGHSWAGRGGVGTVSLAAAERWGPGLLLAGGLAAIATALAAVPWLAEAGISALTLAILLGVVAGNTVFPRIATRTGPGVDLSKSVLLRTGIVLYGLKVTFQQIAAVGWGGLAVDAVVVGGVFLLAVVLGPRLFGLDRQTSMLIGAGSAICGAAAVMATEPVVRAPPAKVAVAVATVVVFGTCAMVLYPLLYPVMGLDPGHFGVYAGSTVHEVAQVVAVGDAIGPEAADTAVITKMMRVMLLAPFLLVLSWSLARPGGANGSGPRTAIRIPWFAVLFVGVTGVHSTGLLPAPLVDGLVWLDTGLLTMAMAALGLHTPVGALRKAGLAPLGLAAVLFAVLVAGGYGLNRLVPLLLD